MNEHYRYLKSDRALQLASAIQNIFWENIFPIRKQGNPVIKDLGTFISSVLKIDNSEKFNFIDSLQEEFPFLSKHMFVFDLPPKFATPIHLDNGPEERERINGKRLLSINIPIKGCDELCPTEFFQINPKHLVFMRHANITAVLPGAPKELTEHYVLKECPVLVNTQIPHRVNNLKNDKNRTSVSWTIKDSWSWDEVVNYLES